MKKIFLVFMLMCLFLSGCAMDSKEKEAVLNKKLEDIYYRLGSVENKMGLADQRLSALENSYNELSKKKEETPEASSIKSNMTIEDIQTALKNAGFYNGSIDGKIGPAAENAIKEFQKANGLKADGIAGPKTKALLIKHLASESY